MKNFFPMPKYVLLLLVMKELLFLFMNVMLLLLLTTDIVAAQMKKPPRKSKEVETPTRQETSCQTEQSTVAGRHVYLIQILPTNFLIFFLPLKS